MTGVRALFANAQGSAIRELNALAQLPDVISLAGGMPDPALMPLEALRVAYERVLAGDARGLLQYGPTDGLPACRQAISGFLREVVGPHDAADWLITSGSQQGLDLIARTLLDPGDAIAVETHAYPAALQAFRFCEAAIVGIEADGEGMLPDALRAAARKQALKAIYLVPTYGNPTGSLMGLRRRLALLQTAADIGALVIEDDPYRALGFEGEAEPPPSLHRLAAEQRIDVEVVHLTSFSKTIAPALRVGALLAPPHVRRAVVLAKQSADIHSALIDQAVLTELLGSETLGAHLADLRRHYAAKGRALHDALQSHAADLIDWQRPRGGMFIWGTLKAPARVDTDWKTLFRQHRVLFVPGREFSAAAVGAGRPEQHLRLSFAHPPVPRLAPAAERLSALLRQALAIATA
jgi:DNA-binding transcriptional MocR family regulator